MAEKDRRGGRCCGLNCSCIIAAIVASFGVFVLLRELLSDSGQPVGQTVWMTEKGGSYHRRDCRALQRSEPIEVSLRQALAEGHRPCSLCHPPGG